MPRIGVLALLASGVLLLGWFARSPLPAVDVASAQVAPLAVHIGTNGTVEPIESAEVRARLAGRITYIPEPGSQIAAGEPLLRIDVAQVSGELSLVRSERLAAQESLSVAERELSQVAIRSETDALLFKEGGITPERHRQSRAELAAAAARVEFLTREVPLRVASLTLRANELEAQLEAAELRAPFAGTLYDTNAKLGETVAVGDLVLWFANLDRLRVRTNIDQVDLGVVSVGQTVEIASNAYPERRWSGQMSELIPRVVRKQARLVAEGLANVEPPAQGLLPGMTVDVKIRVDAGPAVLQVPADSLFTDAAGSYVLRVEDGRVQRTRVKVGRSTSSRVEIVEGLASGDSIVIGPRSGLPDGATVQVRSSDGA